MNDLTPDQLRQAVEMLHDVHDDIEGTELRLSPHQAVWLHTSSQVSDWLNTIIDNPEDFLRRNAEAEEAARDETAPSAAQNAPEQGQGGGDGADAATRRLRVQEFVAHFNAVMEEYQAEQNRRVAAFCRQTNKHQQEGRP